MKQYIVTQTGVREHDIERTFVIEVPDDMNPHGLSRSDLEALADEAEVEWEDCDCVNVEVRRSYVEEPPADGVPDGLTVVGVEE